MYDSPRRCRGQICGTDARARVGSADLHEGAVAEFQRRHARESAVAARGSKQQRTEFAACLRRRAADPRNLHLAIEHLTTRGGPAPGPDGLVLRDLDVRDRWLLARALGRALADGTYRPGPHRSVAIPKASGRGHRVLAIQDVQDRVVQRAVAQILDGVVVEDGVFVDGDVIAVPVAVAHRRVPSRRGVRGGGRQRHRRRRRRAGDVASAMWCDVGEYVM
jgi:hypothetical protein